MKQLLQRLDTGTLSLADVPSPAAAGVRVVVRTHASVISAGTERMLVQFGRSSMIDKARSQPDKVRQVLEKVRTDGLATTLDAVRSKLATPIPLGYCNAGVVVDAGPRAGDFRVGDRVVTNGSHAELVSVPRTLVARIPDGVEFEAAAFTPVAAIGLQGIRLAAPALGETVVVYGLGLIGLLCVQLLRASGCRVVGVDRSPARLALAERFGAVAVDGSAGPAAPHVLALTGGIGADAVLLTLASDSDEPVHDAATMARQRGRIVLVGTAGLRLVREDFYRKELTFQVSCSYGPGRYDPQYEDAGHDYPPGFVRWTEQRNFEAVLGAMAAGQLDPTPLVTHRFAIEDAADAYAAVATDPTSIGIVLHYPSATAPGAAGVGSRTVERRPAARAAAGAPTIAVVGAGNFAVRTLLPLLKAAGARLRTVATTAGPGGAIAGEAFDFERVTTDVDAVFGDPEVDAVCVLTRHDSHARLAVRALEAGKHAFVEKPLALRHDDLEALVAAAERSGTLLMGGFNRRFAPLTRRLVDDLAGRAGPLAVVVTVNAGAIPRDHWTQDPEAGGGRIVGEACHFIDLARHLVGSPIARLGVVSAARASVASDDVAAIHLAFDDGSIASIQYLANGSKQFPKERVECFADGATLVVDNWRDYRAYGRASRRRSPFASRRQDKGHAAQVDAFVGAIRDGGSSPIPLAELREVAAWSIVAGELARDGGGERVAADVPGAR